VSTYKTNTATPIENEGPGEPLLIHEKSLTQKIGKGSEARDIVDQQIVMLGMQLVTQLSVLIKTSRLHGQENAAFDKPIETMLTLIAALASDRPVILRVQNDFLFLGETHLKATAQEIAVFSSFIDSLNAWKVGGLLFDSQVKSKDLREFAHAFVTLDSTTHSLQDLQAELGRRGVEGITLEEPRVLRGVVRAKATAKSTYAAAAGAVGDLTQRVREGGTLSFKHAKRAIQNIVDLMNQDEASLLGLTNLRCHDQYTHNHSVNVALLSMALGNRAGFPKVELADLGLAALFHDMGKASIPQDILNKPGDFTEEEWAAMRSHPTEGVLNIAKLRGITNLPGRMVAAAFEHHMNCDHSGYPKLTVSWKISLTGRILMIADCYDAMTSSRVYRREPISPARTLQLMLAKAGTAFDPVLMKLFVTCVGIVPIGSLVMLDSNELAVVLKPAKEKGEADRPRVKVITDPSGQAIDDGPELDLTEKNSAGEYTRSIMRLVDNTEYKFDTARYFV
jgi:HD-GYP domain-containing protein (c-di-GMP phosphodiesterase class II)